MPTAASSKPRSVRIKGASAPTRKTGSTPAVIVPTETAMNRASVTAGCDPP